MTHGIIINVFRPQILTHSHCDYQFRSEGHRPPSRQFSISVSQPEAMRMVHHLDVKRHS